MVTFVYGANFKVVGKTDPNKLSYPGAWKTAEGTFADLAAHIGNGHPWMPALLDGNKRRWHQNANYAHVLALDIDGEMTLEDAIAHPFISEHAGLIIESASSTAELHKFRIVFRLHAPIGKLGSVDEVKGNKIIKTCNRFLQDLIEVADPACKDPNRFFYGAPGKDAYHLNESATLPDTFVEDALSWDAEQEAIAQREYEDRRRKWENSPIQGDEKIALVQEALKFIPARGEPGSGTYDQAFQCVCAMVNEFGETTAIAIAEGWSPSHGDWNIPQKVKSLKRGASGRPVTIGTLFHIAKQNGFKFPRMERQLKPMSAKPLTRKDGVMQEIEDDRAIASDGSKVEVKKEFPEMVEDALYSDTNWICVHGKMYRWTGTHYEYSPEEVEKKRIAEFAKRTPVRKREKRTDEDGTRYHVWIDHYCYTTAQNINRAYDYNKLRCAVKADVCNPPGLNCKNGVLRISYDENNKPQIRLEPHSPDRYYLYEPMVQYNIFAPSEDCDRLLSALDAPQQEVLLRTVAAALDIEKVRECHGRIRAILAYGRGSNGKDSHREAIAMLWGKTGMSSVATEDFEQCDQGRKFPISPLAHSLINWPSENRAKIAFDGLQSFKRAVSGDPMHFERKGVDQEEFIPRAVHILNINDTPNLKAGMEAMRSRIAVISYNKTFVVGANPLLGQIEVDPRFKYSKTFIQDNILSALLNRLLHSFECLMAEGIDYSCCDKALEEIQIHNSHLFEWGNEIGLRFDPKAAVIPVKDLWEKLEAYYRDTDILKIDINGRRTWAEDLRPGDPYVKGANQLFQRLVQLFPQIKLVSIGCNRKGIQGLTLGMFDAIAPNIPSPPTEPEPPQPDPEPEQKELVPAASNGHAVPNYKPGDRVECARGTGVVQQVKNGEVYLELEDLSFAGYFPTYEIRPL